MAVLFLEQPAEGTVDLATVAERMTNPKTWIVVTFPAIPKQRTKQSTRLPQSREHLLCSSSKRAVLEWVTSTTTL